MRKLIFTFAIVLHALICAQAQKVAFMRMQPEDHRQYLTDAIIGNLTKHNMDVKGINQTSVFQSYDNKTMNALNQGQIEFMKAFGYDFVILHKSEISGKRNGDISALGFLQRNMFWKSDFLIFSANSTQYETASLTISTSECDLKLESCSDINAFVAKVKAFVTNTPAPVNSTQGAGGVSSASVTPVTSDISNSRNSSLASLKATGGATFKVVRVKERNPNNNYPVIIDIYDKTLSLSVGDNVIITKTEQIKIPGEKKPVKSETTIGRARITESFNKPLYTAKLIGSNTSYNMKDFKDGDEQYSAVKGEEVKTVVATPKIMVIPKKIDPSKFVSGEYNLSKEEKMLLASFKNKLEDNRFTTVGFESAIKSVFENRILNDNTNVDIKTLVLESSGADFYVEFESISTSDKSINLMQIDMKGDVLTQLNETDENGRKLWNTATKKFGEFIPTPNDGSYICLVDLSNENNRMHYAVGKDGTVYKFLGPYLKIGKWEKIPGSPFKIKYISTPSCDQVFDFKIRNYATSEDVASDIKSLNTCGSPDDFKTFAASILSAGALTKINNQFSSLLSNGRKIALNFTILTTSSAKFEKEYKGIRLEEHIENCIQELAFNGNYRPSGVVSNRMGFSEVSIPLVKEETGQNYSPNAFALDILKYLKDNVGIECEKSVIGQNVNINIK